MPIRLYFSKSTVAFSLRIYLPSRQFACRQLACPYYLPPFFWFSTYPPCPSLTSRLLAYIAHPPLVPQHPPSTIRNTSTSTFTPTPLIQILLPCVSRVGVNPPCNIVYLPPSLKIATRTWPLDAGERNQASAYANDLFQNLCQPIPRLVVRHG